LRPDAATSTRLAAKNPIVVQPNFTAKDTASRGIVFAMLAPLGVSQLVLALRLIAKGFREPMRPHAQRNIV
jgi:hypothetical protein